MKKEYMDKTTNKTVSAIQWTGKNLGEVIDMVGLNPSVEHIKWEDYEALVKKEGFIIFTSDGTAEAKIGNYITYSAEDGADVWHPVDFLNLFTVIEEAPSQKGILADKNPIPTMDEIKKWIPLEKMDNAGPEVYEYRIQAAYDVKLEHQILTPIPYVGSKEIVLYEYPELVALCPVTFILDIYKVDIKFIPGQTVPELKSLKYNLLDYMELPISHEHLASRIHRDLRFQLDPEKLQVILHTNVRGGITTTIEIGDKFE